MADNKQLELNPTGEAARLSSNPVVVPQASAQSTDNVIPFDAAKSQYLKLKEQDLARRVSSWNQRAKSS